MCPELNILGNRIRDLREEHELTQKELSSMIGLTPKMISFYENNQRTPPIDILLKLAKIFDVDINYLLGISDSATYKHSSSELSLQESNLLQYYRGTVKNDKTLEKKYGPINKYFPNATLLSTDESELFTYYNELSLKDKRWIMGQMIDLIKKSEEQKSTLSKAQ